MYYSLFLNTHIGTVGPILWGPLFYGTTDKDRRYRRLNLSDYWGLLDLEIVDSLYIYIGIVRVAHSNTMFCLMI